MQPLNLTLKGFRGIRDGLGLDLLVLDLDRLVGDAELVALAGANGRGKSTVLDNLHPYLIMPSRAAAAGPGGFSYYDHVFLPENEKDLTWAHEGRSYRSQVVIRLGGRRRTEAYLHRLGDSGQWEPVRLADGTVSDGKVDTYIRCVEAICGSADTFFTSVFSAQGRRPLSSYRNAEIKALLADMLGQEEIRVLGQKAADTARLLKTGLATLRQEVAGLDEEAARIAGERNRLACEAGQVEQRAGTLQTARAALEAARNVQSTLAAQQVQARATDLRRAQWQTERRALVEAGEQAGAALTAQDGTERRRLERLQLRIGQRIAAAGQRRQALQTQRRQYLKVLQTGGAVRRARRRHALAERVAALRQARAGMCRQRVQELSQCEAAARLASERLAGIEQEAGKAALRAQELARRFGLTGEVPCAGLPLQGQCKLLVDAHAAQALVPSAKAQIGLLAGQRVLAQESLAALRGQGAALSGAPQALALAERRADVARQRAARYAVQSARAGEMEQVQAALFAADAELATLGVEGRGGEPDETADEQVERQQIAQARSAIAAQRQRQAGQLDAALKRLDVALAALPEPFDPTRLAAAARRVAQAGATVATAESAHLLAVREAQSLGVLTAQSRALAQRRARAGERVAAVESELSNWNLFARCMSHDGLIALAIDDAGPTLSAMTNDLLLACYGPRFTVSIHTLVETGNGEHREGFDIVVHDGESGDRKSVSQMSGGERVWVNEALTRAVALYLAQLSGRRYTTLFCDEADGPLDPDRKRMFMAMKREVLRLGGYEREFFVSQTPELTAMADAVIDLDAMAAARCEAVK